MPKSQGPLTDELGIDRRFQDAGGEWHKVSRQTHKAIAKAMGEPAPQNQNNVLFAAPGVETEIDETGKLILEDGQRVEIQSVLPADLPPGYHEFRGENSEPKRVIVAPRTCYLPEDLYIWGWALQLYALRSRASWGMGDLSDLREFAQWSAEDLGASLIMLNPLGAATPGLPQNASPYFPSSRRFRNPLYLKIEEVPGAETLGAQLERAQNAVHLLNRERIIDRDSICRLKIDILEMLWGRFGHSERFESYCSEQGSDLKKFAVFCALCEQYGRGWRKWPEQFRRPSDEACGRIATESWNRVRFFMWLQWLLDEQLARASEPLKMMQDLPIGVDPDGADAWLWQDLLAQGVSVGAPPDLFNTKGQNWGLPPFIPHKLRAAGYEPFIQTIRAAMRHAGGLRIDHVMGLFRLFWIPSGMDPQYGTYVRYNPNEMLAIIALESQRAKAFVVGEDLGTVEEGVREKMAERKILSYRLLWFEEQPPSEFPRDALAAISTHDLPTVAGVWTGSDLAAQKKIGLKPNTKGQTRWKKKLAAVTPEKERSSTEKVIVRAYQWLATAPSRILTASLDDALAVEERPNMPATVNEWPNWSLALPEQLEAIQENKLVRKVAAALAERRSTIEEGAA